MKIFFLPLILVLVSAACAAADEIVFIVNSDNPVNEISPDEISDFFMKKKKQWQHGEVIRFFDRVDDTPERDIFLRSYLKKSVREIDTYWIGQKLYTGHSAPSQVRSDSLMCSLISRFNGAIGYVAADFPLPKGVKRISIRGQHAGTDL